MAAIGVRIPEQASVAEWLGGCLLSRHIRVRFLALALGRCVDEGYFNGKNQAYKPGEGSNPSNPRPSNSLKSVPSSPCSLPNLDVW